MTPIDGFGTCSRGVRAGLSQGLGDIPFPRITNTRARFYFTEAGWQKYGRHMYAAARQRGHSIRVIRRKNPLKSARLRQPTIVAAQRLAPIPRSNNPPVGAVHRPPPPSRSRPQRREPPV